MMKSKARGLILFPDMARRPLLITMIINGQKLSATPIRAGRSRRSHKGKVLRFMGAIIRRDFTPPILCLCFPQIFGRSH